MASSGPMVPYKRTNNEALNGPGGLGGRPHVTRHSQWSIMSIDLKFVLASQQWATILISILVVVIPVAILYWNPRVQPSHRSFRLYDATISYPLASHDSVPYWVAFAFPFILLVITVLVGEFVLSRTVHENITNAVTTSLHFIIDSLAAFLVALLVQMATKSAVGYMRPDFLARCQPVAASGYTFALAYGQNIDPACSSTDAKFLADGRSSFPSGHATMSAVFEFYTAGYFLWCIYSRHRQSVFGAFVDRRGWRGMFLKDLGHALALYWILLNVGLSWAIAGSRVVDNRHSPADIVAGFFLGATVAVIFLLRSIPTLKFVPVYDPETPSAEHLRGGEHGVGDNRQELAELGAANGAAQALQPDASPAAGGAGVALPGQVPLR